METRKLYYENPHLSSFQAQVLTCEAQQEHYAVTLDATAFYPEGGGQAGDTGTLGTVRVLDTREAAGRVIHLCSGPLTPETRVTGTIDYENRFRRMQQHSGEHIVSGIIHRRFGYHNTGFHMGSDIVTIDFDGVIPGDALAEIEAEANAAVWRNLPVRCWYPAPEELPQVTYRAKRALSWPVRIVEIPGFDTCACCGTHVEATGEIGLIKLFGTVPFRGGTRMEMACGESALKLLSQAYVQNKLVSQAFSARPEETASAAQRMNEMLAQQKYRIAGLEKRIFAAIAGGYAGQGDVLHLEKELDSVGVRELADAIAECCGGRAAVFSGSDETGYAFCLVTRQGDLRSFCRDMTAALHGRGGGKPVCQQGRVNAPWERIAGYFA